MRVDAADVYPTIRAPCATRWPRLVCLAYSSSTWFGSRSPVIPAKRYTSDSLTVLVTRVRSPMGTSSMPFLLIGDGRVASPPRASRADAAVNVDRLPGDE